MIEPCTPPHRRVYGYHVCQFLLGDTLAARCDLQADRSGSPLILQGAFLVPGQEALRVAPLRKGSARLDARLVGLDRVEIGSRGELAAAMRA